MPARQATKTQSSDQSQDSDNEGIMTAVAKQLQTSLEKKKRDRESSFLKEAKEKLDKCGAPNVGEFVEVAEKMDSIYEQFILDYAHACDETRRILTSILEERQKFLGIVQRKHASHIKSEEVRERGHIRGLAMVKKAIEDYTTVVNSLKPSYE